MKITLEAGFFKHRGGFLRHGFTAAIKKTFLVLTAIVLGPSLLAVIRDGGVDPNNLGQGGWLYYLSSVTNKLGGTVSSVTNEDSLFLYLKSQGFSYAIVKAGASNKLWTVNGQYVPVTAPSGAAFTSNLVQKAHARGILLFASNRSWGNDIPGEIAVADYCFSQQADGFIFDAESEWEASSSRPWITNAAAQAWGLCSTIRAHWPNKFIAHNPYDTLYIHQVFPFKEFGYWCDCVMPQVYHHAASEGNAIAAIHWTDVNYKLWQDSLYDLAPTNINGTIVYWTNSIKPLALMRDVYNGGSGTPVHPDNDVGNFLDYMVADPNCVTKGGYNGSAYFRSDLHTPGQWANMKAATIGSISNVVNNIIMDDAKATMVGGWTLVKTIDATTADVIFSTGSDTNSFGTNYFTKGKGTGTSYMRFPLNIAVAGQYNVYEWHPTVAAASTNVPFVIDYGGGVTTVYANQTTNAGKWSSLGQFTFAAGTNGSVRITDNFTQSSKVAAVDGIKLMFVYPSSRPAAPTNLVAVSATNLQVNLSWADVSTNEASFILRRGTSSGGPYTNVFVIPANRTNYFDTNVVNGQTYYYVLWSTNYLGASTNSSNEASVLAGPRPPVITNQPLSQVATEGTDVSFFVAATGTPPLTYRWKKNGVALSNGGSISGVTTTNLVLTAITVDDVGTYTVTVANSLGSVTSSNAVLSIEDLPPWVVTQPANKTVNAGARVSFSVQALGTLPLSYQWKKGTTVLADGGNISGAKTATLVLASVLRADAGSYSVIITNSLGSTNSSTAVLTVNDPAINSQPVGVTNLAGATTVFTVAATGTSPLTYQWKKNNVAVSNGGKISGATSSALTISNSLAADAGVYTVTVSNTSGVTSSNATLVVIDPIINADPVSCTNVAGTTATFSVNAYGTTPLNYQWRKDGTVLSNSGRISGATTATLSITNVSQADAGAYSVLVSNTSSNLASKAATLVVIDPVVITSQPAGQSVMEGTNVTLSVQATGTAPLSYQWLFNGMILRGALGSTYTIAAALTNNIGNYSVAVANSAGPVFSSNAFVMVYLPFRIENISATGAASTAVITWTTTSNSTSQVKYGLTPDCGTVTPMSTAMVQTHSVLLTGLLPDTNYYFRVVSTMGPVVVEADGGTFFTPASIIVDDADAYLQGDWVLSAGGLQKYNGYFEYTTTTAGAPTASARFTPTIVNPGKYSVYAFYSDGSNHATNVPVLVTWSNGSEVTSIDESTNGSWRLVSSDKMFDAGTSAYAEVSNDTGSEGKVVIADAFKWTYDVRQDYPTNGDVPNWWIAYYLGTNTNLALDPDGDGYSSYDEYIIGSMPMDPSSHFDVKLAHNSNAGLRITFSPYLPDRAYHIETSDNLVIWQEVTLPIAMELDGSASIQLPASKAASFYRVSVGVR